MCLNDEYSGLLTEFPLGCRHTNSYIVDMICAVLSCLYHFTVSALVRQALVLSVAMSVNPLTN